MNATEQDISSKMVIDSLRVVVLAITIKELMLLRGELLLPEVSMTFDQQPYTIEQLKMIRKYEGVKVGSSVSDGYNINPKKKTYTLKCFTRNFKEERTKAKLGICSDVEFHLEEGLWVPRILELVIDKDSPTPFLCKILREPEEKFTYSYEVEKAS